MSMIDPDDDWMTIAIALLVFLALLCLLAGVSGCCQTCPTYDRPVMVDASQVRRCGNEWCVSDGWMAQHDADDERCNSALDACLTALQACPE